MGMILWGIGVVMLVLLPEKQAGHVLHKAERACHCQCGYVVGWDKDMPAPAKGEAWDQKHLWGEHALVCFPGGVADLGSRLAELQDETDRRTLARMARPNHR